MQAKCLLRGNIYIFRTTDFWKKKKEWQKKNFLSFDHFLEQQKSKESLYQNVDF